MVGPGFALQPVPHSVEGIQLCQRSWSQLHFLDGHRLKASVDPPPQRAPGGPLTHPPLSTAHHRSLTQLGYPDTTGDVRSCVNEIFALHCNEAVAKDIA